GGELPDPGASPAKYLHLQLKFNPAVGDRKLHQFRVVDAAGKTVGELSGHFADRSILVFESEENWASLKGLYLDGLNRREPLFRTEVKAPQVARPEPVRPDPLPPARRVVEPPTTVHVASEPPLHAPRTTVVPGTTTHVVESTGTRIIQSPTHIVRIPDPTRIVYDNTYVAGPRTTRVIHDGTRVIRDGTRVVRDGVHVVAGDTHVVRDGVTEVVGGVVVDGVGVGGVGVGIGDGVGDGVAVGMGVGIGDGVGAGVGAGGGPGAGAGAGTGADQLAGVGLGPWDMDPLAEAIAQTLKGLGSGGGAAGVGDGIGAGAGAGSGAGAGAGMGSGPGAGPADGTGPGAGAGPGMGAGDGPLPGMGPGAGPGQGPGEGTGQGPGQGPGTGPGPGMGAGEGPLPGMGPAAGPGQGPGQAPGAGPGDGAGTGPGEGVGPGPGQGPGSGPGEGPGPGEGEGPGPEEASAEGAGGRGAGAGGPGGPQEAGPRETGPREDQGPLPGMTPPAEGPGDGGGGGGGGANTLGTPTIGPNLVNLAPQPRFHNLAPNLFDVPRGPDIYYFNPQVPYYNPQLPYFDPRLPQFRPGRPGYGGGGGGGGGFGNGYGGGDYPRKMVPLPPLGEFVTAPQIVLYISCGDESGPGQIFQVTETGRVLGMVNLPFAATGLALHREHGLVAALPRDGGKLMRIDDTGKVSTLRENDETIVHPVDVALAANSDTIVVADNISDCLAAMTTAGSKPEIYHRFEGQKWENQQMSVAVTTDKHVIFGTNGGEGIYRFAGDDFTALRDPLLPRRGGVAADTSSLKWAATQSPKKILVFEGEELMKELELPANKRFFRHGLLSFSGTGAVVVAARDADKPDDDPWLIQYETEENPNMPDVVNLFKWDQAPMLDFVVGPRMFWERHEPSTYKSIY
ncbi:MAG TPA: hypothetical protein VMY37_22780, partial [Thermoguttaceae bacterium]|nr:hypothetical protein [Thermoguttaceae bacterium]